MVTRSWTRRPPISPTPCGTSRRWWSPGFVRRDSEALIIVGADEVGSRHLGREVSRSGAICNHRLTTVRLTVPSPDVQEFPRSVSSDVQSFDPGGGR